MDLNPAVMTGSRGIPISNRAKVSRLTLKGYTANLNRYGSGLTNDVKDAALGLRTALANSSSNPLSQSNNPYGRILDSRSFKPGMGGLGDDYGDGVMTPTYSSSSGTSNGSGSSWLSVLGTFASNLSSGIGLGIASKLGYKPPALAVPGSGYLAPKPTVPTWVVPAALVGGAGVLYLALRKR